MFITFEGGDGAGKSGHIPFVADLLSKLGWTVLITREPGGTHFAENARSMLLNNDYKLSPESELLLMFASRKDHLEKVIEPALARGEVVICDRFVDSTFAYQGGGSGISADRIEALDKWCAGKRPDITLLFDVPVDVAFQRISKERVLDRFETEAMEFHQRVRNVYLDRASKEPHRFTVIDANRSIETIRDDLKSILSVIAGKENHIPTCAPH